MKNLATLILPLLLLVLIVGTLDATVIKDKPTASSSNGNVYVSWSTISESNVLRFEVFRAQVIKNVIGDFAKVGSVDPQGPGRPYEFIDKNVFKTTGSVFAYKVRVVFQDETSSDSEVTTTAVLSSTFKQTWGSIKALFR
jgi:hypothetical protein